MLRVPFVVDCSKVLVNHTMKTVFGPLLARICGGGVSSDESTESHVQVCCFLSLHNARLADRGIVIGLFIYSYVHLLIHLNQTLECDILKTNELILIETGITSPQSKGRKRLTLGARRSKVMGTRS